MVSIIVVSAACTPSPPIFCCTHGMTGDWLAPITFHTAWYNCGVTVKSLSGLSPDHDDICKRGWGSRLVTAK